MPGLYYEELEIGMEFEHRPHRTVTETDNLLFEGAHLCDYSFLMLAMGRLDDARRTWDRGVNLLHTLGDHDEVQRKTDSMNQACKAAGVASFPVPA